MLAQVDQENVVRMARIGIVLLDFDHTSCLDDAPPMDHILGYALLLMSK